MPRAYVRLRETTFDLYVERDLLPGHYKVIAVISSWLILAGYVLFAIVFTSRDADLNAARTLVTAVAGGLLVVGYIGAVTTAIFGRSLLFLVDGVVIPTLTASLSGLFVTIANFALHTKLATAQIYMSIPLVAACITTAISVIVLGVAYREVVKIRKTDERRRWHLQMGPYAGSSSDPRSTLPIPSPDDEAQRRQLMRLLQDRQETLNVVEETNNTFKIDLPGAPKPGPLPNLAAETRERSPVRRVFGLGDLMPWRNTQQGTFKDARERRREEIERSSMSQTWRAPDSTQHQTQPPAWGWPPATSFPPGDESISDNHCSSNVAPSTYIPPPLIARSNLEEYAIRCEDKHQEAETWLRQRCNRMTATEQKTRYGVEIQQYLVAILHRSQAGIPTTSTEYQCLYSNPTALNTPTARYRYVVCTSSEARELLKLGTPKISIVIPWAAACTLTIQGQHGLLNRLRTHDQIDVQRFDNEYDETNPDRQPVLMDTSTGIQQMKREDDWPINLLSLTSYKNNPFASCVADLSEYNVLHEFFDTIYAGKRIFNQSQDLSNSTTFLVCGKRGAIPLPHRDPQAVVTLIFCEDGEKLWPMYPHLTPGEEEEWSEMDDMYTGPRVPTFILHLQPGDLLIQPSRRIHCPSSITDVLLSGSMHWHTCELVNIAQIILDERDNDAVTNEVENLQAIPTLAALGRAWEAGNVAWRWPCVRQLPLFQSLLPHLSAKSNRCYCDHACTTPRCPCHEAGEKCGKLSHSASAKPQTGCKNHRRKRKSR